MKKTLLLIIGFFLISSLSFGKSSSIDTFNSGQGSCISIPSVSDENAHFFKVTESKTAAIERHRIWLNFTNTEGAFKQLLVGYITGGTNGVDNAYDGLSIDSNKYIDFYSRIENQNYVIQGRALPFNETDKVPLGYKTAIEGTFEISIAKVDGLFTTQTIFIEDKVTNIIHNLKDGSFSFNTGIGVFNDRFVLRYTDNVPVMPPVVLEPPVAVSPPVIVDLPVVTVDPPVIMPPAVVDSPVVVTPPLVEEPVVVVTPPIVAEPPVVVDSPIVVEPPVVAIPPNVVEPPIVVDTPIVVEPVVVVTPPIAVESPVVADLPIVVEPVVVITEPIVVDSPVAVESPVIVEPEVVVSVPIVVESPIVVELPIVVEPVVVLTPPIVAEPSVVVDSPVIVAPEVVESPVVVELPVVVEPVVAVTEPIVVESPIVVELPVVVVPAPIVAESPVFVHRPVIAVSPVIALNPTSENPLLNRKEKSVVVSVRDHQIKINSLNETMSTVVVYDLKGRMLYENGHINGNEFVIQELNSSDQFLIVVTELVNANRITKKIVF